MNPFMRDYVIVNEGTGLYYDYFYDFPRFTTRLFSSKHFDYKEDALSVIAIRNLENCVVATVSVDIRDLDEKLEAVKITMHQ